MADTPVQLQYHAGKTITATLYPKGSDTAASSDNACTEATNRDGTYTATITESLTGTHEVLVYESSVLRAHYWVDLSDNTATHYCHDDPPIAELSTTPGATPTAQQAAMLLYMDRVNGEATTATARIVKNDNGDTIATQTLSDDGTTFTVTKAT